MREEFEEYIAQVREQLKDVKKGDLTLVQWGHNERAGRFIGEFAGIIEKGLPKKVPYLRIINVRKIGYLKNDEPTNYHTTHHGVKKFANLGAIVGNTNRVIITGRENIDTYIADNGLKALREIVDRYYSEE